VQREPTFFFPLKGWTLEDFGIGNLVCSCTYAVAVDLRKSQSEFRTSSTF